MLGARSVALVSKLAPAKSNVPTWKAADSPNSDVDLARLHRNVSQQLARLGLRRQLPTAAAELGHHSLYQNQSNYQGKPMGDSASQITSSMRNAASGLLCRTCSAAPVLKIGALSATPRSCMSSRTRRAAISERIFSACASDAAGVLPFVDAPLDEPGLPTETVDSIDSRDSHARVVRAQCDDDIVDTSARRVAAHP